MNFNNMFEVSSSLGTYFICGLGASLFFATSALADPVSLECRYVNSDQRPDWIAVIRFDSDEGDAELTAYSIDKASQPRFHRNIERLPIDRRAGKVSIRRADLEKTYIIDRRTLRSRTERERITEIGTRETVVQLGTCRLRDAARTDSLF